ncbi:hypothetical protein HJG60_011674 [Phyllostomus discolor]|uniref:Uncharacterized protein n=1 Tax=Phyllostomus discolor TaxID=89673 RepID=A0A833ZW75_9CHIR|nr:hypothetical protein HJG60_011674 [Phyllostomus discolor]
MVMPVAWGYREDSASQCVESTSHSACGGSHALDVALVAVVKIDVAPRTPGKPPRISWGPQVEKIILHHVHALYRPLDICIHPGEGGGRVPPRKCATGARWQATSEVCHLLASRHVPEALSFQTGEAELRKDATLEEDPAGPRRRDCVPSSWGCCDYLGTKAQQREPIWLVNYP